MKTTTKVQLVKSTGRRLGKVKPKALARRDKVVTFKVSNLTKPWALNSTESIIRALSGSALDGVAVHVEINGSKPTRKRGFAHA